MPETTGEVIITSTGIVVFDGKDAFSIVAVRNGDVDASEKEGGALGLKITKLTTFLGNFRQAQEASLKQRGQPIPDPPELMIIADRTTPYRLLVETIYSAKDKAVRVQALPPDRDEARPDYRFREVAALRSPSRYTGSMKLVGERRAIAALVLAFYTLLYVMNALLGAARVRSARSAPLPPATASPSSRWSPATSGPAGSRSASRCSA